ncbi:hypothetical protein JRO89_XS03G0270400 [Xanthoceras sorbifolium]|uniref:Uncharacterized protein n=1 Tax=Xanthoceras sorbifolium TaxID=99658 RepID=A0ABQ8IC97_9ROSI|nr:hypothetical protein JRO89_XS03G0270400 [Xanthoceras sorbifolium]
MAPNNLDIILVAFLHGAFIACVLLLLVSLVLIAMLLSSFLTVFSIVAIDLYTTSSMFSSCFKTAKANLELGFVLVLCTLLRHAIAVVY